MPKIYDDPNYKDYINKEVEYIRDQFRIRNVPREKFSEFFNSIYEIRNGRYYHQKKYDSLTGNEDYFDKNTSHKIKKDRDLINNELSKFFLKLSVSNFDSQSKPQKGIPQIDFKNQETRKKVVSDILKICGYTVESFLGAGGYNTVFRCKSPKGKDVACKVVVANRGNSMEEYKLESERKIITDFRAISMDGDSEQLVDIMSKDSALRKFKKYSNTAKLKFDDIGDYNTPYGVAKLHYLVSEAPLMDSDIWDAYNLHMTGGLEEIRRMGKAVLKVLIVLHSKNIAHLDIKPGNILQKKIDGNKTRYNLTDFGLSVDGNVDIWVGRVAGSPGFVSPDVSDDGCHVKSGVTMEQLQKCDIYALGASLFEFYLIMRESQVGEPINYNVLRSNAHTDKRQLLRTYYDYYTKYSKYFPEDYIFLSLIRKMMATKPEKRPTAEKCLQDAFFSKPPPPPPAFVPKYTYGNK